MRTIKHTVLVVMIMMVASVGAYAQAQLAIGVKGGLNFAKLNTDDYSASNRTGFHGGAFALIKLTKIGIQPEIIFSQQGSKFKIDGNDVKSNFSYVNIPVMLKLYLVAGLNLQAGPQFGFLSSAKIDGEDVKDSFKKSDVSVGLGAGWDLPFGLTVDARYNLGVTKIQDDAAAAAVKNQVIQISLGYKLIKLGN